MSLQISRRQLALGLCAALAAGCVRPERSVLDEFFAACRLRDTIALATIATTIFEPLKDGIIIDFEILDVRLDADGTKTTTISAPVRRPDGTERLETLLVTMQRGARQADPDSERRWIITAVRQN